MENGQWQSKVSLLKDKSPSKEKGITQTMAKRIITTENLEEDIKIEGELRPQLLTEYIGQEKAKETLKVYIEAAKARKEALDHVLFHADLGG